MSAVRVPDFGGFTVCLSRRLCAWLPLVLLTKPGRRDVPDERPLQPRNASHGGMSLTPRVPAAPCSGVADLVFVRLIIIINSLSSPKPALGAINSPSSASCVIVCVSQSNLLLGHIHFTIG